MRILNFQIDFSCKQNVLRRNVILHFRLSFTRRITSCRLFSPFQSGISHVRTYLINFQNRFPQKRGLEEEDLILHFRFMFLRRILYRIYNRLFEELFQIKLVLFRVDRLMMTMRMRHPVHHIHSCRTIVEKNEFYEAHYISHTWALHVVAYEIRAVTRVTVIKFDICPPLTAGSKWYNIVCHAFDMGIPVRCYLFLRI